MNLSLATLNTIERLECKGAEMRAIICGALLALTITTANAAEQDVNSAEFMLPYCRLAMNEMLSGRSAPTTTNESAYLGGVCAGMVHAVSNMFYALKGYADRGLVQVGRTAFCTDTPVVTPVEAIRVVLRYAELHPEKKDGLFFVLAMNAMGDAWPCKN